MSIRHLILSSSLSLALSAAPALAQAQPVPAVETAPDSDSAAVRLARQWARAARIALLLDDPLHLETIEAARRLVQESLALERNNPEWWRVALLLGTLAEDEDLIDAALLALSDLDPLDDTIALRRLTRSVEQLNTVSDRVARCEEILAQADLGRIAAPLASRVALDLALLHRRHGDSEGFADSLARAVNYDPANRAAMAIAAGYFRLHVDDPVAEAELLLMLVEADLTDTAAHAALAKLCLDTAAYDSAERLYTITLRTRVAGGESPSGDQFADLALAEWAAGHDAAALETIRGRQNQADIIARSYEVARRQAEGEPTLDPMERDAVTGPIAPSLATVRAAIRTMSGDSDAAAELDETVGKYLDGLAEAMESDDWKEDVAAVAEFRLQWAWMTVWLGSDFERARTLLDAVEEARPMRPEARARFDGWIALRQGDLDTATALLEPLANAEPPDLAAAVGLSEVLLARGQTRAAARTALSVARSSPGSVIGVWCANRLAQVLGQRAPIHDAARAMDELVQVMPRVVDRYPTSPNMALQVVLRPRRATVMPFEPIMVDLVLINSSPFRLAIDRDGPIRPQVICEMVGERGMPRWVVDIDRRLSLAPGERLVIPVDLSETVIGWQIERMPVRGALLRMRATVNPLIRPNGALIPGALGSEAETKELRIDGVRGSPEWISESIDIASDPQRSTDPDMLPRLALLATVVAPDLAPDAPAALFTVQSNGRNAIVSAFTRLDEVAQAWLVGAMTTPVVQRLTPIRDAAQRSPSRLVRMAYMMNHVSDDTDPVLADALASGDPALVALAEYVQYRNAFRARQDSN